MSRAAVLGLLTAWSMAACVDASRLVRPRVKAASVSLMSDAVLGSYTLSPPPNSVDGTPARSTGIPLPSGAALRVTVSGKMDFTPNPAWLVCFGQVYPPLSLMSVGPWGFPPAGDFGVEVGEGDAAGIQAGAFRSLQPADGTSDTAGVNWVGAGGVLWVRRSGVSETCGPNTPAYLVSGSQLVVVRTNPNGGGCATPPCPPPVTIVASARGPGSVSAASPNGSFTAKGLTPTTPPSPAEDTIKLHATVTPAALAPRVTWQVKADPQHFPTPWLVPPPTSGADAVFRVLPLLPDRWPVDHKASLDLAPKQLSFVFTASVQDDQGQAHTSSPVTVTQNDTDTVREEYVEFMRKDPYSHDIPVPEDFVTQVDAAGHFQSAGSHSLNDGDYSLYIAQRIMLDALDEMWSLLQRFDPTFTAFVLTSGYRNPVHHTFHVIPNVQLWNNSAHQYGLAADIRITDQQPLTPEQFFNMLSLVARQIDVFACFEPASSIKQGSSTGTLDHAHVDWMPACDPNW